MNQSDLFARLRWWQIFTQVCAGLAVVLLMVLACMTARADPKFVEIDVHDECHNWTTRPSNQWVNSTGTTYAIASLDLVFGGADSLVGEMGMWVTREGPRATLMYSFPQQSYAPPTAALIDRVIPPADARFTIQPGERVGVSIECGPVSVPSWRPFSYYGSAKLYLVPVEGKP
jgi:hypothetical protein